MENIKANRTYDIVGLTWNELNWMHEVLKESGKNNIYFNASDMINKIGNVVDEFRYDGC